MSPRVLNPFNATLETKSFLDYLIFPGEIIVCNFTALDTMHQKGLARHHTNAKNINKALYDSAICFARLSISSPDKLLFKLPLTSLYKDATIRDDIIWLCAHLEKQLDLDIYAEFLKSDFRINKVQVQSAPFLRLAIQANT